MAIVPYNSSTSFSISRSTTTLCATSSSSGMDIQDPHNLVQRDDEVSRDGRVFTSSKPLEGYRFSTRASSVQERKLIRPSRVQQSSKDFSARTVSTPEIRSESASDDDDAGSLLSYASASTSTERLSPFCSRPITLIVGGSSSLELTPKRSTTLVAHEDLLTSVSSFFKAALSRTPHGDAGASFAEAHTGIIRLPDDRPDDISFLLQWAYWHTLLNRTHTFQSPNNGKALGCSYTDPTPSTPSSATLYHPSIDPYVHRYMKWKSEKRLLKATFGPFSEELRAFRKQRRRPRPPAFGPLIRLYIIADKYDVCGGLKEDIVDRADEVSKLSNCVPDAEDIWGLWDGVVESVDSKEGEQSKVSLKVKVLELYAGLNFRSMRSLFAEGGDEVKEGGGNEEGGYGKEEDGGELEMWHPTFLRDLLLHMVQGRELVGLRTNKGGTRGVEEVLKGSRFERLSRR